MVLMGFAGANRNCVPNRTCMLSTNCVKDLNHSMFFYNYYWKKINNPKNILMNEIQNNSSDLPVHSGKKN